MTTLEYNFDAVVEPAPLPKGRYPTQVTAAVVKQTGEKSKNPGRDMIVVTIGFTGPSQEEQNAPVVNHFLSLPHPDDEKKSNDFKALQLKRFGAAYNVRVESPFDMEAFCFEAIGAQADIEVTLSDPDENGNVYNRIQLPRLRS